MEVGPPAEALHTQDMLPSYCPSHDGSSVTDFLHSYLILLHKLKAKLYKYGCTEENFIHFFLFINHSEMEQGVNLHTREKVDLSLTFSLQEFIFLCSSPSLLSSTQ